MKIGDIMTSTPMQCLGAVGAITAASAVTGTVVSSLYSISSYAACNIFGNSAVDGQEAAACRPLSSYQASVIDGTVKGAIYGGTLFSIALAGMLLYRQYNASRNESLGFTVEDSSIQESAAELTALVDESSVSAVANAAAEADALVRETVESSN